MSSFESLPDGAPVGPDPSSPTLRGRPTGSAGFGSPGTDATVRRIDLNDALIRHPQATFVMRAAGNAMREAGIDGGDVLLVDRALAPMHGQIVVAVVDGELMCRRLFNRDGEVKLQAADPDHADIVLGGPGDGSPLEVWGVVTTVIKSLLG